MIKSFATYQTEQKAEHAQSVNVRFFDTGTRLLLEETLDIVSSENLRQQLDESKPINFKNAYFNRFELPEQTNQLNMSELRFVNSFFDSKDSELNFSAVTIAAGEILFDGCVFSAKKINFNKSVFEATNIRFENCRFFSDDVDFSESEFYGDCSFKHSKFSDGKKNFKNIRFTSGADFTDTEFEDGDLMFTESEFNGFALFKMISVGQGRKDFSKTKFSIFETTFEKSEFGNGDLTFRDADFKSDSLNFNSLRFGIGKKEFGGARLGTGELIFKSSNFSDGKISFRKAAFGDGEADFHFCTFGDCDISFDATTFGVGKVNFQATKFGNSTISFRNSIFANGDISFQAAEQAKGSFLITGAVLGNGIFDFSDASFPNSLVTISDVDFGQGKVSLKNSVFHTLSFKGSQLDNYFDLRLKSVELLDLADTIVKDIVDIAPYDRLIKIENLKLSGMRLLGRLYLDWQISNVKQLIYKQQTTHQDRKEQFRILKENYGSNGQYSFEDEAYVEFKRCEARAHLEADKNQSFFKVAIAYSSYSFNRLIFDMMGKYATSPMRVLFTMLVTYLLFTFGYLLMALWGDSHIISSLFPPDDPRVLAPIARAFYHSAITFLTIGYGDYYPDGLARWLSSAEGFVGLFQMSYFTVAFARKALR